jgi:hypothetical protein
MIVESEKKNAEKKAESNIGYLGRHTKNFFTFKT